MSPSRTGPLTFRTIDRPVPVPASASMNSTRTWVTFPVLPVRPNTLLTLASLTGWSCFIWKDRDVQVTLVLVQWHRTNNWTSRRRGTPGWWKQGTHSHPHGPKIASEVLISDGVDRHFLSVREDEVKEDLFFRHWLDWLPERSGVYPKLFLKRASRAFHAALCTQNAQRADGAATKRRMLQCFHGSNPATRLSTPVNPGGHQRKLLERNAPWWWQVVCRCIFAGWLALTFYLDVVGRRPDEQRGSTNNTTFRIL